MAKLWFCRQGNHPTISDAGAVRPFTECKQLLQLAGCFYLGSEATNVRCARPGDPVLASARGGEPVIVALDAEEAKTAGWKPGYYYSPLTAEEAFELLGLWV